ncbi:cytochrome D ubiquinol oxidase subunit III [Candidatus Palibaumannia cicadellinicola]|uniref:Z-ring associated protein G n=1 Tax=Candidatus Palibaumannia cicadellinicola TaxID=186490 RepID=A0A2N4XWH6_9GAMM|nr:Z-ring associated protein ZapG [Candidatus Baumannia cicadellinicola]PLK58413.1 cytochrome D ubiquinol oxidase subunit III [Candidatus Baumannia cicadellinicola]
MTWKSMLIGFLVGIIIGAVVMRFGNRKLRQQQMLQNELEKSKAELDKCRKELNSHFARSAELLDNMANSYRQLYQHMVKSSNRLLPTQRKEDNPFRYRLTEADNDQIPAEIQPWDDSPDSSSEIPSSIYVSRNK